MREKSPSRIAFPILCALAMIALRASHAGELPLPNPGFEDDPPRWTFAPDDRGQSRITPEAAREGNLGLEVTSKDGSSVYSRWLPAHAGNEYEVTFWARAVQNAGFGVYLLFFDTDKRRLGKADAFVRSVPPSATDWTEFRQAAVAPEGTAYVALWLHSFSSGNAVVHLDDFILTEKTPKP